MANPARATIAILSRVVNDDTWLSAIPTQDKQDALNFASDFADGYLRVRYSLPLVSYGEDLLRCECWLAAKELVVGKGYSPEGRDKEILDRAAECIKWLDGIAAKVISPSIEPPIATGGGGVFPRIVSRTPRGWTC